MCVSPSVHVTVKKDASTEILNFVTEINSLIQYFYSSEISNKWSTYLAERASGAIGSRYYTY